MKKKVLFVSAAQPISGSSPSAYSWYKPARPLRLISVFLNHPGLSFLKANIPDIEILEYPSWKQFKEVLKQRWDVLGISFYINETRIALRMAEYARKQGVKEVWAGNYGAYSPEVGSYFDRSIIGWGEGEVARALGLHAPKKIDHPPIYIASGTNLNPRLALEGVIFTSRGCSYSCKYCQTPRFYGKPYTMPIGNIERVLQIYDRNHIKMISILDENFGIFRKHTEAVIKLFKRYDMRWMPLCRVDVLLANFTKWKEHGLFGAHLGIESLSQRALMGANKKLNALKSIRLLRLMNFNHMLVQAFYMIGFEEDTLESIRNDILELRKLNVDLVQTQIVTPYPNTDMYNSIKEKYGIIDTDLNRYNSRNLVWNHPNISPNEMDRIQKWATGQLSRTHHTLLALIKYLLYYHTDKPTLKAMKGLTKQYLMSRPLYRQYKDRIKGAKQWLKLGWPAYEEASFMALNKEMNQVKNLKSPEPSGSLITSGIRRMSPDFISKIFSPPTIAIVATLVFSLWSPIGLGLLCPALSILLGFLLFGFLPFLPIFYFHKKKVVDLYVSKREARTPFFLMAITSYSVATLVFFANDTKIMFLLALGYTFVTTILMLVNLFWKVSTHCAGVTGPIFALVFVFGINVLPLFLILVPLSWSRIKLKNHTFAQTLVGIIISIVVGLVEYNLLYH